MRVEVAGPGSVGCTLDVVSRRKSYLIKLNQEKKADVPRPGLVKCKSVVVFFLSCFYIACRFMFLANVHINLTSPPLFRLTKLIYLAFFVSKFICTALTRPEGDSLNSLKLGHSVCSRF